MQSVFSQTENPDSLSVQPKITLESTPFRPLQKFDEPKLFIPLHFMESFSAVSRYNMGFRRFDELTIPNRPADQLKLLYSQYQKGQEYKLFYSILGSLQTGAAAYMAYEHIRKHGLFK